MAARPIGIQERPGAGPGPLQRRERPRARLRPRRAAPAARSPEPLPRAAAAGRPRGSRRLCPESPWPRRGCGCGRACSGRGGAGRPPWGTAAGRAASGGSAGRRGGCRAAEGKRASAPRAGGAGGSRGPAGSWAGASPRCVSPRGGAPGGDFLSGSAGAGRRPREREDRAWRVAGSPPASRLLVPPGPRPVPWVVGWETRSPAPQRRGRCRVNVPPELALGPGSPAPGARSRRRGPSWTRRGFRVPFPPRRRVRRRLSANPRATGSAVGPRTRVLRAAAAPPPLPPASGLPASPSGNLGRGDAVPRLGLGVPDPRPGRGRAVSPRVPVPPRGPRFVWFVAGCEVPAAAPGAGALSRHHVPGRQAPRTSWFLCCC